MLDPRGKLPYSGRGVAPGRDAGPSKADHVYREIKEAILSGTLQPGSPIDKSVLCERLGMSRFPVTEAINRLAFERLVTVEPQHGSFVAKIAATDVRECMMIRTAIEGDIAATVAADLAPGLADALDKLLADQCAATQAGDRTAFYTIDIAFHRLLCASLGFRQAGAILDSLRGQLERVRRILTFPPGRMEATSAEHRAIVDAIAARDPDRARLAMRHHLAQTTAMFDSFAQHHPDLFSNRSRS